MPGRLNILWGILASVAAVMILLILIQHFRPVHTVNEEYQTLDSVTKDRILSAPIPDVAKKDIVGLATGTPGLNLQIPLDGSAMALGDDARLRVFDEL